MNGLKDDVAKYSRIFFNIKDEMNSNIGGQDIIILRKIGERGE